MKSKSILMGQCAGWASIVLMLVGTTRALVGCAGASDALKSEAAAAAYLAEQLECVDRAATRDEATACRNAVKAKWAAKDGGQ